MIISQSNFFVIRVAITPGHEPLYNNIPCVSCTADMSFLVCLTANNHLHSYEFMEVCTLDTDGCKLENQGLLSSLECISLNHLAIDPNFQFMCVESEKENKPSIYTLMPDGRLNSENPSDLVE